MDPAEAAPQTPFEQTTGYLQGVLAQHGHYPEITEQREGPYVPMRQLRVDPTGEGYVLYDVHVTHRMRPDGGDELVVWQRAYDCHIFDLGTGIAHHEFRMPGHPIKSEPMDGDAMLQVAQDVQDALGAHFES